MYKMIFQRLKSLFFGRTAQTKDPKRHLIVRCTDCDTGDGQLHDLFCTKERCPFCRGQLMTCECAKSVLDLSQSEQQTWDEYEDDSMPPLSNLLERWKNTLDAKGRIPFSPIPDDLIWAAYRRDMQSVERFLADGFSPNAPNEVGYTPMMGAARGESVEVLRLFLSRGGNAQKVDHRDFTALHWAVGPTPSAPARQLTCIQLLIKADADVNARDNQGGTPLMKAGWFGCIEAAQELLRHGADKSIRDKKGRSAGDMAAERGHLELSRLLS